MWERLNQHQEKAALQQGSKAALGTGNKQVFKGGGEHVPGPRHLV